MTNTDYAAKAFINRQKRLNQVKRHKIALIVFFIFSIIVFISFSTEANDNVQQLSYKYLILRILKYDKKIKSILS